VLRRPVEPTGQSTFFEFVHCSACDTPTRARKTLYADLLEAEALWNNELNDKFKLLYNLERELVIKVRNYLSLIDPDSSDEHKMSLSKIDKKTRDIIYDFLSAEDNGDDEYKNEFNAGIKAIESNLKSKLSGR
jgi:hypothetical protein